MREDEDALFTRGRSRGQRLHQLRLAHAGHRRGPGRRPGRGRPARHRRFDARRPAPAGPHSLPDDRQPGPQRLPANRRRGPPPLAANRDLHRLRPHHRSARQPARRGHHQPAQQGTLGDIRDPVAAISRIRGSRRAVAGACPRPPDGGSGSAHGEPASRSIPSACSPGGSPAPRSLASPTTHLTAAADPAWRIEQMVDAVTKHFEHYLAWTIGALTELVNTRLADGRPRGSAVPRPRQLHPLRGRRRQGAAPDGLRHQVPPPGPRHRRGPARRPGARA